MNSRILGVAALAMASFGSVPIQPARGSYRLRYSKDGSVCQYPKGFPLPQKRKPRSNKNRNYRKARKAGKLTQHCARGGKLSAKLRSELVPNYWEMF